jgi:ribosomal protein L10
MKSAIDTAVEEAVEEREIEIAKNGILKGYENNVIADLTNLTVEQIEKLRSKLKK